MSLTNDHLLERLRERFNGLLLDARLATGQITLELLPESLIEVCLALRDEPEFSFAQLSDVCGVDYLNYGKADWETMDTTSTGFSRGVDQGVYAKTVRTFPARFASVYQLLSLTHNRRLRVRCFLPSDPPQVSSVTELWPSANWFEREAFDLFGILFEGHPDLRRILTDYGFMGHPFRKDFPLEGNVEVRYDPDQKRVIYQPVTIENRVLVPRVIRDA
ncbi:MAG TPA: NADH-quinone oxidoreductase subunit C [Gammaproteobacteria bacterium]|nr:NADH-quinone oxidoreductase subunit C [Gammaproteobacteria bacterium]